MLKINLVWDTDALAAPQSFRDGVQAAADILQAAIYDPITLNIEVGYGEYDLGGPAYTPLTSWTSLGGINDSVPVSYAALRAALASKASTASDAGSVAALPDTAALDGQSLFYISTGLAKAFGAIAPDASMIDGYTGFPPNFTGTTLVDAAITELMHAAGLLNDAGDLGLFAYTSPGDHYLAGSGTSATSAYFSLDGGNTDLASYAVGFDETLFSGTADDPLTYPDQDATTLTPLDLSEIGAIGFDVTSTPVLPAPEIATASGTRFAVHVRNVSVTENHSIPAASMIASVSAPRGDSIPAFVFEDEGSSGGHFELDGVAEPDDQPIFVLSSQVESLTYVGGPAAASEWVSAGAYDDATGSYSTIALTATTTPATAASVPASDFDGDGDSDLLLQNANGAVVAWLMKGTTLAAGRQLAAPGPTWHAVATGDFDGDGKSDILLQNDDGSVVVWTMDGAAIAAGANLPNPGPSWHALATGDFNGDGTSDILFQNDDGTVAVWTMNGATVASASLVADPGPTWHAVATGDFNGDGRSDILLQNDDGTVAVWTMNGATVASASLVADPGPTWHAVATGDFNGDGKSDILLQNNDGTVAVWLMNGAAIAAAGAVASPGPTWHAIATGDYNGDGKSDIALQNDDGSVVVWEMNGASLASGALIASPDPSWQVIGAGGMHFIDATRTAGTVAGTIQPDDFVFTTFLPGAHAIAGFDPAHDVVTLNQATFPGYAAVQAHETQTPGGVVIDLGGGSSLTLANIAAAALASKNFV